VAVRGRWRSDSAKNTARGDDRHASPLWRTAADRSTDCLLRVCRTIRRRTVRQALAAELPIRARPPHTERAHRTRQRALELPRQARHIGTSGARRQDATANGPVDPGDNANLRSRAERRYTGSARNPPSPRRAVAGRSGVRADRAASAAAADVGASRRELRLFYEQLIWCCNRCST
jgi:hypothetical protein